jgi:predicted dehydrogenase
LVIEIKRRIKKIFQREGSGMNLNVKKESQLLRVGVLGCGIICQAGHLEACSKAKNIRLEAVCDVADDLREKIQHIYEPPKSYARYEDMLSDPDIDAVIIGIGDQFHVACAKQALESGKHVLLEKPMGISISECEELEQVVEKSRKILQIGNMKRFDGGIQYAKEFLDTRIGEVTTFKGWYCDSIGRYVLTNNTMPVLYQSERMKKPAGNPKEQLDHYYLLGHGSHLVDTARFLLGDIESVTAQYVTKGKVHSWLIGCIFTNGAIGNLDLTIPIAQEWHEGFEIYGTKGSIFAKTYNPWEFRSSKVQCCEADKYMIHTPYIPDGHFYRRQLENFSEVIMRGKKQTGAMVTDGTQTLRVLIAINESVHQSGKRMYPKDMHGGL